MVHSGVVVALSDDEDEDNSIVKPCMSLESMRQLYEMRMNNVLCDAVIKLDDKSQFNVHRNILSACSSFFRALFTTPLNTNNGDGETVSPTNEIPITGIRGPILEQIINYSYLRQCSIDETNMHELYVAADYCGMIGLMRICVDFLVKKLTPTNCISMMLFAKARFCKRLYQTSRLYLLRNFPKVAVESVEILKLKIDDFHEIVNDELLNVKDEQSVWECCLRWIDYDASNRECYVTRLLQAVRLGLLDTNYFNVRVKDHPYVSQCQAATPLIIETLKFIYDLDIMNSRDGEITTPSLAMPRLPHEVIFAIGGWSEGRPQSFIESYDTRADRWVRVKEEDPAGPRAYHGTAVIGYKIYCIGGFDGFEYFNTCRCFDTVKKTWKEIAPMHSKRCYVSVAMCDDYIYAMGGYDGQNRQNTVERYDTRTNQWTVITPMQVQRSDACACSFNGKVYITGGFNGQECLNSAEIYDPETQLWALLPNMSVRRSGVSCVAHKGCIFVIGGFNGMNRMKSGEKYDPERKAWMPIRDMYHPRSNFGLEIIDDMIFAIGGFNGSVTISHAECYVDETNEWLEATDMSIIRSALTANVVCGLPNVRDYIHKNRDKLMEERRQRLFANESQPEFFDAEADEDDDDE